MACSSFENHIQLFDLPLRRELFKATSPDQRRPRDGIRRGWEMTLRRVLLAELVLQLN